MHPSLNILAFCILGKGFLGLVTFFDKIETDLGNRGDWSFYLLVSLVLEPNGNADHQTSVPHSSPELSILSDGSDCGLIS